MASRPLLCYFNPRLREGGDELQALYVRKAYLISIHASAREATEIDPEEDGEIDISIHASAREATALITNFYI